MASPSPHRRTFDFPKPEQDLAQWTSKIKELIAQDEEAEHRRLEEEIAASRLERIRRRNTSTSGAILDAAATSRGSVSDVPSDLLPIADRQQNQSQALRRLIGDSATEPPSSPRTRAVSLGPSAVAPQNHASATQPMSLAAFIGGRATGPRLNKPIAQQDAHDPTVFAPTAQNTQGPPLLAIMKGNLPPRAGVALPGLNPKRSDSGLTNKTEDTSQPVVTSTSKTPWRPPTTSSSKPVSALVEKTISSLQQPQNEPKSPTKLSHSDSNVEAASVRTPLKAPVPRPISPTKSQTDVPSKLPHKNVPPRQFSPPPSRVFGSPSASNVTKRPTSPTARTFSSSRSVSTGASLSPTPSLARPIQPSPNPGTVFIPATNPSPAFLKPPPPRDLTPSLTRLQGRGFVGQRVKASLDMEKLTGTEKERNVNEGTTKKASVLDRWPNVQGSTTSPPAIAPKPVPLRKPFNTNDTPASRTEAVSHLSHAKSAPSLLGDADVGPRRLPGLAKTLEPSPPPQRAQTVVPSSQDLAPRRLPGLAPPTANALNRPKSVEPELEHQIPVATPSSPSSHSSQRPSAPLTHLTRDRARKPKKGSKGVRPVAQRAMAVDTASEVSIAQDISPQSSRLFPAEQTLEPADDEQHRPEPVDTREFGVIGRAANTDFLKDARVDPTAGITRTDRGGNSEAFPAKTASGLRRALPGMSQEPRQDDISPSTRSGIKRDSPPRHARTPSTGSRPTAMDIAQVLHSKETSAATGDLPDVAEASTAWSKSAALSSEPLKIVNAHTSEPQEETPRTDVKAAIAGWGRSTGPPSPQQAERRKSSYEKYSAIILPPLKEEKTPPITPAGSLSRSSAPPAVQNRDAPAQLSKTPVVVDGPPSPPPEDRLLSPNLGFVRIDHKDGPLPRLNLTTLLKSGPPPISRDPAIIPISTEVLLISGSTATPATIHPHILHESETAVIVHREKSKSSGLVNTKVWRWNGRKSEAREREEKKIQELATRFGTSTIICNQGSEPTELVHALGGILVTRHESRAHWTSENTAMHCVRSIGDTVFIDEVDLNVANLCSAFSYCVSVLDVLYVWHGRGSSPLERQKALDYGTFIAGETMTITEFDEGNEEEMFWMMLGEEGFANADYWKFRAEVKGSEPRLFRVNAAKTKDPIAATPAFAARELDEESVFVVDAIFEIYVVVGSEARGKRTDIRLALNAAEALSSAVAHDRPFVPPVHVLILPSRIPLDLKASFRLLDEEGLNGGSPPDHINLLPLHEATEHISTQSWPKSQLKDTLFLPLGVHPDMLGSV